MGDREALSVFKRTQAIEQALIGVFERLGYEVETVANEGPQIALPSETPETWDYLSVWNMAKELELELNP